jgi:hypothetical protein
VLISQHVGQLLELLEQVGQYGDVLRVGSIVISETNSMPSGAGLCVLI